MNVSNKQQELCKIISSSLSPLINNNYIFIDLPYYNNIGDVLIWQGTEVFLKSINFRCLYRSSYYTFNYPQLDSNIIILMQGGGNWGDIWHEHNDFRKLIVKEYPENPIIILPQTVFYQCHENLVLDSELFSSHKKLTICARDDASYNLLASYFSNKLLLVPDMAFYINVEKSLGSTSRKLFLKRIDKELNKTLRYSVEKDVEVHDWPTYERTYNFYRVNYYVRKILKMLDVLLCTGNKLEYKWLDIYEYLIVRKKILKVGQDFLKPYGIVYSTRLHVAILSALMGKKVFFYNNSYGKNWNFYNTWLKDLDNIELIS